MTPNILLATLEHSYDLRPKVPEGRYKCVRGLHRLHGMSEDFETFEVTGVPGHTNILFHCGNTEVDSEGCILLGEIEKGAYIYESRKAFAAFMETLSGIDEFWLEILKGEQK